MTMLRYFFSYVHITKSMFHPDAHFWTGQTVETYRNAPIRYEMAVQSLEQFIRHHSLIPTC